MFIDELEIYVQAGNGGSGCTSFRREKYVEFGGPDGGNGGDGGSVIVRARSDLNTLLPLRTRRQYKATRGRNGRGSNMTGACGDDLYLEVPCGTIIRERETGTILGDLTAAGETVVVAQGGIGGKGNKHFASSTNRAPKFHQSGQPGQEHWIRLELKMMADVGLVGFPNAGKSTLISRISAARPKVADYPFTTLKPNLGVVAAPDFKSFVVADIPGIIEGAHDGAGLGIRFLKHIERTSYLLILIDPTDPSRGPLECYRVLISELEQFSDKLTGKPRMIAFTKADVPHERDEEVAQLIEEFDANGLKHHYISSVRGDEIDGLVRDLYAGVMAEKERLRQAEALMETEIIEEDPEDITTEEDPLDLI